MIELATTDVRCKRLSKLLLPGSVYTFVYICDVIASLILLLLQSIREIKHGMTPTVPFAEPYTLQNRCIRAKIGFRFL